MPNRAIALLILVLTALSLGACGIDRRQDRREDRREDRKDPVSMTAPVPQPASTLV